MVGGNKPPSRHRPRNREALAGQGGAAQHAALCSAPESGGLAGPRPHIHRLSRPETTGVLNAKKAAYIEVQGKAIFEVATTFPCVLRSSAPRRPIPPPAAAPAPPAGQPGRPNSAS